MRIKIVSFVFLLVFLSGYGQQDAQFTQYMYNTININPGYAGSREAMSVFAMHRTQWVGLDGAPITNTASVNTPINGSNVGLGVSIINDRIGPSDENNIAIDFSYSINTSDRYKLSFGLKASANLLNIDFNKLSQYDQNDYAFQTNIDNKFSPNIGVGFYLHSDNTYVGLSAPYLLETKHFDRYAATGANSHVAKENINLYLIAGHVLDLSYNVKFKPSLLTKYVQGAPLQVDLSTNFMFNDKFVAGLAYRWSAAVSAMVGFQASDSWFIGYGYDLETTRLSNYNSGSHEIFLRYELFNKYTKIISPRFF
ncbi:type IX secretion system membrane protein PorP/SprF [Flavobacterium sinopsychrotolerans]|jgi:type IX secretion system PorP/SprF family membrane protein|uniref:Type IX secretion system membrane protein, PorP/SprF family n=1 Tax=Flavobacterium sinopsychrotolerans TaxID=604089 RepID=A0A1H8RUT8_9FLAO|nr:type IX secretion system membrane protein PorP/SprF [Flavobacterium sinopsychrotolerans]SEO69918.1 type IX secretion system membrane protein, PorP/SprF family [Flavobacterium sinopsychrotolerans]